MPLTEHRSRFTFHSIIAIVLLALVALAATQKAIAQSELWDTGGVGNFHPNDKYDWKHNWGPFATIEEAKAAAIEWCEQAIDYHVPGLDCTPHPNWPEQEHGFYGPTNPLHEYYWVRFHFYCCGGAHGNVLIHWYPYHTNSSHCPDGKVVDLAQGYDCVEPNTQFTLEPPEPCIGCDKFAGNPVDSSTGNKMQAEIDFTSSAVGLPTLTRYYNSRGSYKTGIGMASGWRHTYSRALDEEPDLKPTVFFASASNQSSFYHSASEACTDGWGDLKADVWNGDLSGATASFKGGNTCEISSGGQTKAYFKVRSGGKWGSFAPSTAVKTVSRPNGSVIEFKEDGSNWTAAFNDSVTLEQSGSDWVFTDANGTEETFSSSGQLISIKRRNGQTETLSYNLTSAQGGDDDSTTLDRVTGPFGHTLTFSYDANGVLETVTTPDGDIDFTYDSEENLASVTYPDLTTRGYVYENTDLPHHLTGIVDENNDRFATWAYDDSGRAISSEHAGGQEDVDLTYNSNGTTTITSASGASRIYTFGAEAGRQKLTSTSGDVCSSCAGGDIKNRTYDSNGFLYDATDWNNVVTRTARNSRGLIETLTEAQGSSDQRVTTMVWHAEYALPTKITTPKNVTDIVYDTDGNPTSITISSGSLSRAWAMTFNNDGQVLTINGPRTDLTDLTTFTYHNCGTGGKCGQLASVTNALNHVTTYDTYDASGRLTKMTEPNGRETSFTYDSRGNALTVTETPPVGSAVTTTMTYDDVGQLATLTTPEGTVLTYTYTAAHYLESVTDSYNNEIAYTYDSMGNLTDEDTYDPSAVLTRSLEYAYGLDERLDSITSGTIATTLVTDLVGNLTTESDGLQNASQHLYDNLNRLSQTTDALSGVTSYSYDDHDNLTSVAAPNSATTSYVYDDLDNLTSESSPDRGLTSYTYDDAGNMLTKTDARSIQATYTYDALNRVSSISYPNTAENVTFGYDVAANNGIGRLTSISDQGGTTTYTYDEFGRVATDVKVISGVTYTTSYAYDDDGNIDSITYPSGRVIDYTRNTTGEITQVKSTQSGTAKTIVSTASYDPFGPVASLTYGNGSVFDYQYGLDGQVTSYGETGKAGKDYEFDAAGQITKISDSVTAGHVQLLAYDKLGRLIDEPSPSDYGGRVSVQDPLAYWRLDEVSGTTAFDLTGNGYYGTYTGTVQLDQMGLSGDTNKAIRINTQGAGYVDGPTFTGKTITAVEAWFQTDSTATNRDIAAGYLNRDDRFILMHRDNGHLQLYTNRITLAIESDSVVASGVPHHVAVWYEATSNKTYMMVDGVIQQDTYNGSALDTASPKFYIGAYQYNSTVYKRYLGEIDEVAVYDTPVTAATFRDRLDPLPLQSYIGMKFEYDANGNRTSADDGGATTSYGYETATNKLASIDAVSVQRDLAGNRTGDPGGIRTYGYSDSNRLNEVLDNLIITATYAHNALGQRVKKTVGSAVTVYIYDLAGNLIAEHDGTGALIRDYAWMNGVPVAQIDSGEVFSYLHFDHLGTPRAATNDSQTVVWRWDSDAFGSVLPDEDPDADNTNLTVNLRFPGQYYDDETGFHYNYFRTYDPTTGRYVESDPIGLAGGLNTYGYALQNPLSYTDVLGLAAEACGGDEDCIQRCLDEYYGGLIDTAWAASPFSLISLGLNEAAEYAEDVLAGQANRHRYTGARNSELGGRHRYATGRRQARLLSVFRRFNAAAAVTGAGAVGFLGGAYGTCAIRCAFE